jgi:hypothetical protein
LYLILAGIVSCSAGSASGTAYVGIFGDTERTITSISPPLYTPFDIWVWWLPAEHGMMAYEFGFAIPSNVIIVSTVQNPPCMLLPCYTPEFCSSVFGTCQIDWIRALRLSCMAMSATPGGVSIAPTQYCPSRAASCDPGYPVEDAAVFNRFGIYQEGAISVEPQTWGGIKSLYRGAPAVNDARAVESLSWGR